MPYSFRAGCDYGIEKSCNSHQILMDERLNSCTREQIIKMHVDEKS